MTADRPALAGLAERAERLRRMHLGPSMLILPNAWDVASAEAFAALDVPAIATTSGGVAAALGYRDGEAAPADAVFGAVQRIAAAIGDRPLTADLEAGYGLRPDALVARLLEAGAVGLNLEDTDHRRGGLVPAERQAERIAAVRAAGRAAGVEVVINARVDVFLRQVGEPASRMDEGLRRARLYIQSGADCVYPIWLADEHEIAAFIAGIDAPVNVYARAAAPPVSRLRDLGVRRVSFGTELFRVAIAAATEHFERAASA